ncbi:MAG: site-specific integrase [Eubacteriales bacterium]|nr:site-specific integrase [Eubacteriales bacterium]
MRLPNGFGSVYKLSGNRRNPWCARKTVGWTFNEEKQKSYPVYQFVGYYASRKDAMLALSDYNKDPYDLHNNTITFAEVYQKWSESHFPKVSESNVKAYKASFKTCLKLHDMKFVEIKLDHMQKVVDESGKNTPTLKKLKILLGLMYDYAVIHEIVSADKRDMVRYLDISKAGNPNKIDRTAFTKKEVHMIWDSKDSNPYMSVILILIHTGVRIGELLDLKKEDVHVDDQWFYVRESKTESGIREVPIADKILPFFRTWMDRDSEYLICTPEGKHFTYRNYYDSYWKPLMDVLGLQNHRPHDTRHTFVSLMTACGVDERILKLIVGHKGQNVTESVYTHLELPVKLEAVNKL